MSDLRKYHSSIIDLNRSHYWWSAGRQHNVVLLHNSYIILLTESKTLERNHKSLHNRRKVFFALTAKFWFWSEQWRNNTFKTKYFTSAAYEKRIPKD